MFPLPVAGSVPKKSPLPWDRASPDHGLGWASVAMRGPSASATEVAFR
jgi:hypothetical protein